MGEVRCFRDDDVLKPKLDALSRGELSLLVRGLLHGYFFGEIREIKPVYQQTIIIPDMIPKENEVKPIEDFKLDMFDD